MTLQDLLEAAAAGQVEGIEVVSLEGGFYVVQARLASGLRPLRDPLGQVLHLRSTTQVRAMLAELAPIPCELVQHCAHDEMCASRESSVQPLRVSLCLEQRW